MAKDIKITDIQINSFNTSRDENDKTTLNIDYTLVDDKGELYDRKTRKLTGLTTGQETKVDAIYTFLTTKIKQLENI